jgi:O-antigen/teichoic acid export membrane protein
LKLPFFLVESLRTGLGFVAVMSLAWTGLATTYAPLIMAMNGATALAAVMGTAFALNGIGLRRPRDWGIDRLGYVLPLVAGTLIGIALNSSDRLITEAFAGPAALATYAAAVTLARQPLEFIFSVVNVRTFPELMAVYEKSGPKAAGERMGDLISVMAMLSCPAAIGLALVADPLARTFLTPAYVDTARLVIPLGAAAGLMVGFKMFVFDQVLHMTKRIWPNILATLPVTLLGVALSAVLASRLGAAGCVVAVLVQSTLALTISIVQSSRLVPIKPHAPDLARIALMCAAMVVAVTVVLATLDARPAAVQLAGAIMIGGVIYAAAGWILKPRPVRDLLPQPSIEGA